MIEREKYPFNVFVPNLLNVCIDGYEHEEMNGRIYHCYKNEPVCFHNIVELIKEAERLFDLISFPQASTKTRQFFDKETVQAKKPEKVLSHEEVLSFKGKQRSVLLSVRFRQNSTWQGEFYCEDTGILVRFTNIMDFIKKIDEIKPQL